MWRKIQTVLFSQNYFLILTPNGRRKIRTVLVSQSRFLILTPNGRRRIRTFEGIASRFTVCPLWPLGNLPIKADERTRTVNLLITNQLLCQLSHIGVFCFYMLHRSIGRSQASLVCSPLIDKVNKPELSHIGVLIFIIYTVRSINGTYRARTCDPLLVRQMLSQLS